MLELPSAFNYIAAFLSFSCQLRCPYCINHHGGDLVKGRRMEASDWILAFKSLRMPLDCPITLQGGEPTVYKGFYDIAGCSALFGKMDLLTNLMFNIDEFMAKVPPEAFKRNAPYASIRVSWHVGQNDGIQLLLNVERMMKAGYQVGVWAVNHPEHVDDITAWQLKAWNMGIDFRLKEFLGPHGGKEYGTFRYPNAVNSRELRKCQCRTSELLIAPDGVVYRCHSDLYSGRYPIGHVLEPESLVKRLGKYEPCAVYGKCNSCDIKVKTNRFQEGGHSSVEIAQISEPYAHNKDYVKEVINTYGK